MILEVTQVNQAFRTGFWMKRQQILFDVSLRVPERSIFGFLGPNGAGKTTLIHLIAGLRKPVSGRVAVMGADAHTAKARAHLGYLPERPYFYEHLTGADILDYFGTLSGMSRQQIRSRTPEVLKKVGIAHAKDVELKKYSKGMLQRIGIAQAILHDPEFLVLDEPMSGLDPIGRKEMRELILALAHEGRTIFFSTHVIPDVEAICNQVALIKKGKLVKSGPMKDFLSQEAHRAEIAFAGLDASRVKGSATLKSSIEIPEGHRLMATGENEINSVIKEVLGQNGKLLWVTPIRKSLEDLF